MKQTLILLFVALFVSAQAQNLEELVNSNATVVIEMNGDQIFSLIDQSDFENMIPPAPDQDTVNIHELGFNLNSKAYYFLQTIDSVDYNNVIIQMNDVSKAEEMIHNISKAIPTKVNGYNLSLDASSSVAWNDDHAIFTFADFPIKLYTMEDLLAEKEEARIALQDSLGVDYVADEIDEEEEAQNLEFELLIKNFDAPPKYSDEEIASMLESHFMDIVNTPRNESVANNKSYNSGKMKQASAYFWAGNLENFNQELPESLTSMLPISGDNLPTMDTGIDALMGNLIFDQDEIIMDMKVAMDSKVLSSYKKMYNSKLAKPFFNNFNADEALAYMNFTTDMEMVMKEYPTLAKNLYGGLIPGYEDEMDIAMDVLEVVLDEEAIGELITGDMMMILHDFTEQEVTYKTVEYDDDFNATEVEKTKMDMVPSFSVMIGSENTRIVNKLMKLARKYEIASNDGKYQKFDTAKSGFPFDMFFTQQDGIVFLTNSQERVGNYMNGKKKKNLGKHKKGLENNMMNMYVDLTSMMDNFPALMPGDPATVDFIKNSYKEMYITMPAMKDDKLAYEVIVKTDGTKNNSLKLIMETMTLLSRRPQY